MLCPAVSDPFYGRGYRLCAMVHQMILIPLIGKLIVLSSQYFKLLQDTGVRETKVFVREIESSGSPDVGAEARTDATTSSYNFGISEPSNLTDSNGVKIPNNRDTNNVEARQCTDYDKETESCKTNSSATAAGDSVSVTDGQCHTAQRNGVANHIGDINKHKQPPSQSGDIQSGKDNYVRQENGHLKQS